MMLSTFHIFLAIWILYQGSQKASWNSGELIVVPVPVQQPQVPGWASVSVLVWRQEENQCPSLKVVRSSLLLSPPTQAPWNSFLGTVGKGVPMGDRGPVNKRASSHLKGHFQPGKLAIWDTDRAKMIPYLHGSQCSCLVSILPASTASCLCGV